MFRDLLDSGMSLLRFVLLTTLFLAVRAYPESSENQSEVQLILEEINSILRNHYEIPDRKHQQREQTIDLIDDIRYTEDQARALLQNLKRRLGHPFAERTSRVTTGPNRLWGMPILYGFNTPRNGDTSTSHDEVQKEKIRQGLKLWSENTCIEFEERELDNMASEPYLFFYKGGGCSSSIGQAVQSGRQKVNIGAGCLNPVVVAHEVGHALGLGHEFMRPDRDKYVTIYWENLQKGKEYNFALTDDFDPANTSYDISSAMQYSSLDFSVDSLKKARTMVPHDIHQITIMGQRSRLQFTDVKRINYAYDCIRKSCKPERLTVSCRNGGYQDPKNCAICRCPSGTGGPDCSDVEPPTGLGMHACGGLLLLKQCELRTLMLPTYPQPYGESSSCTWKIKSPAKGLVFAFQQRNDLAGFGNADTCYDFVEIRTNMSQLDRPGKFFCAIGDSKGRVASVDGGEALVRFESTTVENKGGAGKSKGFLLNVYATCNDTPASKLPTSCKLTSYGYDLCEDDIPMPMCRADTSSIVIPSTTPTYKPRTTTTTRKTQT